MPGGPASAGSSRHAQHAIAAAQGVRCPRGRRKRGSRFCQGAFLGSLKLLVAVLWACADFEWCGQLGEPLGVP